MSRHTIREQIPDSPERQLMGAIDRLVGDSGERLNDHFNSGNIRVGFRRVLMAGGGRYISVGKFDDDRRAQITEEVAADLRTSVGELYGVVETSVGAVGSARVQIDYYVGELGTQAAVDIQHDREDILSFAAEQCYQVAEALEFGPYWTRTAFALARDHTKEHGFDLVTLSDDQTAALQTMLGRY